MNRRDDIERELQALGALDVPGPDDAFVDALEARLLAGDAASPAVVPLARRGRRMSVAAVVAASLAFAGAAAAAGVVVIARPFRDEPAPATSTTVPSVTTAPTTTSTTVPPTTIVAVTTPVPTTVPVTEPPTTVPVTVPPVRPTTVPTTKPTVPPTTAAATTTTEAKVPQTMTLECFLEAGSVRCRWSAGPDGTVRYAILRSTLDGPGTVAYVGPGDLLWIDPAQIPGVTAGYVVHALGADDVSLAHTPLVKATCC